MDEELSAFKTRIDLRQYLSDLGYEVDGKKSTRHETYMRSGPDRINVHLGSNGEWTWFSFSDGVSGSIIDFVQSRQGIRNLGRVRQTLRPWVGREPSPHFPPPSKATPAKDTARVRAQCCAMAVARAHPYLVSERRIPMAVLASQRFAGRVLMDGRGCAVFPHYDRGGICGFEIRGPDFKRFSVGGSKGLWCSHVRADDDTLVFCESAISTLSYAALFPDPRTRYASTAGQPSSRQAELIGAAIERMPAGSEIVSAMDADDAGRNHTRVVRAIFDRVSRAGRTFREHYPPEGKDWNDLLKSWGRMSPPTFR